MGSIVTRLLREEDIPKINALYQKAYGIERPHAKFNWEFLDGPAGSSIYVVAVDEETGQVIGTQCAIPLYVQVGDKAILTAKSEDTLVDSAYRGRRVFEQMYDLLFDECRKKGITALWGFTYAIKPFQKIGFEIPFKANFGIIAVWPLRAFRHLVGLRAGRGLLDKCKILGLVALSFMKYSVTGKRQSSPGYSLSKATVPNLTSLDKSPGDKAFFLRSDEKFLNWRIRRNPYPNSHEYFSLIDGKGKTVACVICSFHADGVAYIMHLTFDAELNVETQRSFLNGVIKDVARRASLIRYWGFDNTPVGESYISLLGNSGLYFTRQGISFVWKKLTDVDLEARHFVLSRLASQGT